jgi:hypothetical protein
MSIWNPYACRPPGPPKLTAASEISRLPQQTTLCAGCVREVANALGFLQRLFWTRRGCPIIAGVGHPWPGFGDGLDLPQMAPGHTLAEAAAEPPPTALRLDQVEKLLTDRSRWHWHSESAALLSTQSLA